MQVWVPVYNFSIDMIFYVNMKSFWIFSDSDDATRFVSYLARALCEKGLVKAIDYKSANIRIHTAIPRLWTKTFWMLLIQRKSNVLLRFEPKVVNPLMYSLRVKLIFQLVVTLGTMNSGKAGRVFIKWPYVPWPNPARPGAHDIRQLLRDPQRVLKFDRHISCSLIASRKFAFHRNGNYDLRNRIASARESLGVTVFGMKWQLSRFEILRENLRVVAFFFTQLYKPHLIRLMVSILRSSSQPIFEIQDKFLVLRQSEFSIVIENSDTYVSEKLLDALVCGAIPIYKGAKLDFLGFPSSAYIPLPEDVDELKQIIYGLSEFEKDSLRKAGAEFVASQQNFQSWTPEGVAGSIATFLVDEFDE